MKNVMIVALSIVMFSTGFVVAGQLTARPYVCSKPVKTLTFVRAIE